MVRIVAIIATILMLLSPAVSGALHAHAAAGFDHMAESMATDQNANMADTDAADCCHAPISHCNTMTGITGQASFAVFTNGDARPSIHPDLARIGRVFTADPPPPRI